MKWHKNNSIVSFNKWVSEGSKKFHWIRLLKARKKINLELLKGKNTITYRIHLYVYMNRNCKNISLQDAHPRTGSIFSNIQDLNVHHSMCLWCYRFNRVIAHRIFCTLLILFGDFYLKEKWKINQKQEKESEHSTKNRKKGHSV